MCLLLIRFCVLCDCVCLFLSFFEGVTFLSFFFYFYFFLILFFSFVLVRGVVFCFVSVEFFNFFFFLMKEIIISSRHIALE